MAILLNGIYGFFATIGFGIVFNVPRKDLTAGGFCGAIGWIAYYMIFTYLASDILATFSGAVLVSVLGELMARRLKKPATLYIIPGIIPLVPGAHSYQTLLAAIYENFSQAAALGFKTCLLALSIASAIFIVSALNRRIFK